MNSIELKTLGKLSQYSFFIPSYQRGYRWTEHEVRDLLNDINEFVPREINGTGEKTWYCLQPIAVKHRIGNEYEVIDGQQRLTTSYLILHCLNQDYVEKKRDKLFDIDYETRPGSKMFLQDPEEENQNYIDFFYMHNAYKTIEAWFEEQEENDFFDKNEYRSKLRSHTKVIWYETSEEDTVRVFTRLNIGKISLTNSELIKALFLNSSNFKSYDPDNMRMRQFEIANEWDGIEASLQNNKLWYFLSDKNKDDNRIEYIFDLMNDSDDGEPYSTFRFFYTKLAGKTEKEMNFYWERVQEYYQRFYEWFNDRMLYHKIGFILTVGIESVKDLYIKSSEMKKSEFNEHIDSIIKNHYKNLNLFDLDYENKHTRSVLLLYNILTMLRNEHDSSYFPFDDFKLNKWNIEHIASRKDPSSVPAANRKEWLTDVRCYIDIVKAEAQELIIRIDTMLSTENYTDETAFTELFDKVTEHFNQYMNSAENVDGISNLALLDEKTNKSYKNAVFPLKRKYIIELDKSGGFVPICTKNVFLKYFSDYPPKISFWTQEDREKYEADLVRILDKYLEVNK